MKLALGTVQFGLNYGVANRLGQVGRDEVTRILSRAQTHGVDTLDTAIGYGESEQRLGEFGMAGWRVISKLPTIPDCLPDVQAWVDNEIDGSLTRLRLSCLDTLLLHRPSQLLGENGTSIYKALSTLKHRGIVKRVGVSIYDPAELEPLARRFPLDVVQAPFNVLDRRLITSGWIDGLADLGIELHVRSVFLQGLLLMPAERRPDKFKRWRPIWQQWDEWLRVTGLTPLEACLRSVLAQTGIARVVIGVDSVMQLDQVFSAMNGPPVAFPEVHATDLDLIEPARWKN